MGSVPAKLPFTEEVRKRIEAIREFQEAVSKLAEGLFDNPVGSPAASLDRQWRNWIEDGVQVLNNSLDAAVEEYRAMFK